MKKIVLLGLLAGFSTIAFAQADPDREEARVREVLNNNIDRRMANGAALSTGELYQQFDPGAQVIETGEIKPNIMVYTEDCTKMFDKITFSNHQIRSVRIQEPFAFTTESYDYEFIYKVDGKPIKGRGAVSCVLQKMDNKWKVIQFHSSHRRFVGPPIVVTEKVVTEKSVTEKPAQARP